MLCLLADSRHESRATTLTIWFPHELQGNMWRKFLARDCPADLSNASSAFAAVAASETAGQDEWVDDYRRQHRRRLHLPTEHPFVQYGVHMWARRQRALDAELEQRNALAWEQMRAALDVVQYPISIGGAGCCLFAVMVLLTLRLSVYEWLPWAVVWMPLYGVCLLPAMSAAITAMLRAVTTRTLPWSRYHGLEAGDSHAVSISAMAYGQAVRASLQSGRFRPLRTILAGLYVATTLAVPMLLLLGSLGAIDWLYAGVSMAVLLFAVPCLPLTGLLPPDLLSPAWSTIICVRVVYCLHQLII